jgi:hypothetical protein
MLADYYWILIKTAKDIHKGSYVMTEQILSANKIFCKADMRFPTF